MPDTRIFTQIAKHRLLGYLLQYNARPQLRWPTHYYHIPPPSSPLIDYCFGNLIKTSQSPRPCCLQRFVCSWQRLAAPARSRPPSALPAFSLLPSPSPSVVVAFHLIHLRGKCRVLSRRRVENVSRRTVREDIRRLPVSRPRLSRIYARQSSRMKE